MKYITKYNYERAKGYNVRLPEVIKGKYIQYNGDCKFFARSHYSTWKSCLADAIEFRDDSLKQNAGLYLLKQSTSKLGMPMKACSRNVSGVIGVSITIHYKGSGTYHGYKATWCETIGVVRKQKGKEFSQDLYGECASFRLACRVRFEHCDVLYIDDIDAIPCLPDVDYIIK